ncbi:helix-turn-helix domain-containing protein [Pseudonocardia spinosispora]|uniref:helix-turn-helix domain-containing protein n=1 Tax=Pseudonocardia spinosispora TaxID=103441 RepID=UPI0006870E46|nr:helix-turn-helix domain-containing protein [Pseudonocardia spinosispora]
MSPKELHRILRFRRFTARLPAVADGEVSVAVAAADLGYADQSHLGRECRRLSGSSPARLFDSWRGRGTAAEIFQTRRRPDAHDLAHEPSRRA